MNSSAPELVLETTGVNFVENKLAEATESGDENAAVDAQKILVILETENSNLLDPTEYSIDNLKDRVESWTDSPEETSQALSDIISNVNQEDAQNIRDNTSFEAPALDPFYKTGEPEGVSESFEEQRLGDPTIEEFDREVEIEPEDDEYVGKVNFEKALLATYLERGDLTDKVVVIYTEARPKHVGDYVLQSRIAKVLKNMGAKVHLITVFPSSQIFPKIDLEDMDSRHEIFYPGSHDSKASSFESYFKHTAIDSIPEDVSAVTELLKNAHVVLEVATVMDGAEAALKQFMDEDTQFIKIEDGSAGNLNARTLPGESFNYYSLGLRPTEFGLVFDPSDETYSVEEALNIGKIPQEFLLQEGLKENF